MEKSFSSVLVIAELPFRFGGFRQRLCLACFTSSFLLSCWIQNKNKNTRSAIATIPKRGTKEQVERLLLLLVAPLLSFSAYRSPSTDFSWPNQKQTFCWSVQVEEEEEEPEKLISDLYPGKEEAKTRPLAPLSLSPAAASTRHKRRVFCWFL